MAPSCEAESMVNIRLAASGQFLDIDPGPGLSTGFWVDPTTTAAAADQTGSALAPFRTIAQGVTALKVSLAGGGTLFLLPGDYGGENVNWAPAGLSELEETLTLQGFGGVSGIGTITIAGSLDSSFVAFVFLLGLNLTPNVSGRAVQAVATTGQVLLVGHDVLIGEVAGATAGLEALDVQGQHFQIDGQLVCNGLRGTDIVVNGAAQFAGDLHVEQSRFAEAVSGDFTSVQLGDCRFAAGADFSLATGDLVARDTLFLRGLSAPELASAQLWSCTVQGQAGDVFTCSALQAHACRLEMPLTATGSVEWFEVVGGTFDGGPSALTGPAFVLERSSLAGNVTATGEIQIDQQTWEQAERAGFTLTSPNTNWVDVPDAQSTLGNAGAAPVVHTVVPAGHVPGIYMLGAVLVSRVAAAGTVAITAQFTDPNAGAQNIQIGSAAINPVGQKLGASLLVVSSGVAAIRVTFTPAGVGAGASLDYWSSARPFGNI